MRNGIIAIVAMSLVANTGLADSKSDSGSGEGPGVAIGTIAGAVLGGPVGFVIGGGLGGWLSNKLHKERTAKEDYQARYEEAEALAASLDELLASNEAARDRMRLVMNEQESIYRNALDEALDIHVYFRTGESALDEPVAERIERLGELMQDFEDFAIVVEGHADPRGGDEYNEQLSAERAAAVRATLIRSGMSADRVTLRAAGESGSEAADGDLDAMALERRVDLTIVQPLPRENRVARQ